MSSSDGSQIRVLVVDDNMDAAKTLSMLLERLGYGTRAVYDPLQAVPAAEEFRPDFILSDIGMPGMSGYELAAQFRQHDELKNTPLIAVTAVSDESKIRSAGFDRHLVKPVDVRAITSLLRELRTMSKQLEQSESVHLQRDAVMTEVRDLVRELKGDVQELKSDRQDKTTIQEEVKDLRKDLQEVKHDIKQLKDELLSDKSSGD